MTYEILTGCMTNVHKPCWFP